MVEHKGTFYSFKIDKEIAISLISGIDYLFQCFLEQPISINEKDQKNISIIKMFQSDVYNEVIKHLL